MSEAVNHPKHYQKEGRKECIKEMEERFGVYETCIFALLSAYKYIYRAGEKEGNSKQQDIDKAQWYLSFVASKQHVLFCDKDFYQLRFLFDDVKKELEKW